MGRQIIECVPNFSEGRDRSIIRQIADSIASVEGVRVLNIDPGEAANRTVITFVGEPHPMVEAAFRGAAKAAELIDMRNHHGTHPRQGATDVLPLIPVSGITLEECAVLARNLAQRMATELSIPCYSYEAAAFKPERRNLAVCRAGEYEALEKKLTTPDLQPDFMPADAYNTSTCTIKNEILRSGCSVVGARDFLIAVNFNLNTTDTHIANAIAFDVREKGRPQLHLPGRLKCCKALGWFIDEYGIAQVSMNLTNLHVTPLHRAYEEVCRSAKEHGVSVTGTEIIGLLPLQALTDAGRYFLQKEGLPTEITEAALIEKAIRTMGLDELRPFNADEKVIEYML